MTDLQRLAFAQTPEAAVSSEQRAEVVWQEARRLEHEGQSQAAFWKYLLVPGGEAAAVSIARPQAQEFLAQLAENGTKFPAARRKLVEGDLRLALRDRTGALAAYREAAAKIAKTSQDGWEQGLLPRDEYFVEPSAEASHWGTPAVAFSAGPGSHRDNWLIRRFIALEAWDDAQREFERVAQLHREATQPFVIRLPKFDEKQLVNWTTKHIVRPAGFNGRGLQFALDRSFFLQRRGESVAARDVLLEALLLIDMDRDPNSRNYAPAVTDGEGRDLPDLTSREHRRGFAWAYGGASAGVTRTEFIRLAYGALKSHGHEAELDRQLKDRIAGGENRLRRVLAQVRLQQGQPDAALQLELDYIAAAKLDPLSTAYRRAIAFDAALQVQDAVREFETVLALRQPASPQAVGWNVPEPLERDWSGFATQQAGWGNGVSSQRDLHVEALTNLERLYVAFGHPDRSLEVARQLVLESPLANYSHSFDELSRKHRAANQSEKLLAWAKEQLANLPPDAASANDAANRENIRANLYWLIGDTKSTAQSVAKVTAPRDLEQWKQRFRAAGTEPLRELLKALIAAHPKDAKSHLELLDLDGVTDGPQLAERLELLLQTEAEWAFPRGKGARNRTQFKDHFDLAYRLIRLYERAGQYEKLQALGLRIARGEKPFGPVDPHQFQYRDANGLPERANAALAVVIQQANSPEKIAELKSALENSVWSAARTQLERRIERRVPQATADVPWANAPRGVRLIVSTENVLALTHDERHVYSGHPWGVAVHDHAGQPVTRIALGEAARCLVVLQQHVWVGTPKGLFRIDRRDWSVAHQWLHEDVAPNDRHGRSFPGPASYWFDNSVYALTADGEDLWIGLHRNVQRLNTRTLELRAYSFGELKIEHWAGFSNIVVDGRYVWASSDHAGVRRYDRNTDEWSAVQAGGKRQPVRFVGIVDDRVFGNVYVDDQLRNRLCLIDRETLAVRTIPVVVKKERELINSPLRFFGKRDGRLAVGADWPAFVLDDSSLKLHPIVAMEEFSESLQARKRAHKEPEPIINAAQELEQLAAFQDTFGRPYSSEWITLTLPNGMQVLGKRQARTRYEYPNEDNARTVASAQAEMSQTDGGLFFVKPTSDGTATPSIQRVSAESRANAIRSDSVHTILFGTDRTWLCTSFGVALLDRDQRVSSAFSRADGLCSNRVTGAAEQFGKTFFSTAWGDSGGGLALFDPQTSVFTTLMQEDGLSTDKLEDVQVIGDQLRLTFGAEYLRFNSSGDLRYRRFPPLNFDPRTNRFGPPAEPVLMKQEEAEGRQQPRQRSEVPLLGGTLIRRLEHDGRLYLCGTRGLVISDGEPTDLNIPSLGAKLIVTPTARQLAESESRPVMIKTPRELEAALQDENPFYRANAIASLTGLKQPYSAQFLPLLISQLDEKNSRLRATALYFVTKFSDDELVVPALRDIAPDADPHLRHLATLELVRRGHVPDIKRLQELLDANLGNYPFGAKLTVGVLVTAENLHRAIAQHATPEIFEWLLQAPPRLDGDQHSRNLFRQLASAMLRHPKAIDVLLKAHDDDAHNHRQRDFARDVFRLAATDVLPQLHAALKSKDRIERSNAARACGAIKDETSIQALIDAADLESGLSRAAIVWALGELQAKSALPLLAQLYAEAKADEKRSLASGHRFAQQAAFVTAQYDRLSNLDALTSDWDDLKHRTLNPLLEPSRQEELLQPQHVLEALAKIGAEHSQDFYRALAGSKDTDARNEAAERLAAAPLVDRDKNVAVLKSLLTDAVLAIRLRAAVGLILLGDISGQDVILDALNATDDWSQRQTLLQLARLPKPEQRQFAAVRIKEIATSRLTQEETRRAANNLLK